MPGYTRQKIDTNILLSQQARQLKKKGYKPSLLHFPTSNVCHTEGQFLERLHVSTNM